MPSIAALAPKRERVTNSCHPRADGRQYRKEKEEQRRIKQEFPFGDLKEKKSENA